MSQDADELAHAFGDADDSVDLSGVMPEAWLALAFGPSILNCSCRCAILTCSPNSMVRKCSSMAPHKWLSRVLLGGLKVWRRIKLIIR